MKITTFLSSIVFILSFYWSRAQSYTPITFNNYNPLWTYTHNTPKVPVIADTWIFLEQNADRDNLVINDGILYNVYNIVFGPAWIGGYYLEARELSTGRLLWDNVFYSENIGERRFSQHPKVIGDSLELLIYEEFNNSDTLFKPIWFTAFPRRILYNKHTGKIIDSSFGIQKDAEAKKLPVPWPPAPTHLYFQEGNFIVINHLPLTDTTTGKSVIWYNRFELNLSGKVKNSNEILVQTENNKVVNTLNDLDDNKIFSFFSSETSPDSLVKDFDIGFHYRDNKFEEINSGNLNILTTGDVNNFGPMYVNLDHFIIGAATYIENPYYNQIKYLAHFDNKGNLVEKLDLKNLNIGSENESLVQTTLIKNKSGIKILFCVSNIRDNTLDFYLSDGADHYSKTKSLLMNPQLKKGIFLNKLIYVNGNVLCYLIYRETATGLKEAPLWSSWAMLKGEDLGIVTSAKDISLDQDNELKITPNPVSNMMKIEFKDIVSGKLFVYNQMGQLVFQNELNSTKEFNYNVSHLLSGSYRIQFVTDHKILNAQFIKN